VVGPFLILLIFGLGYRENPPPFRTLLVVESEQSQLVADREELGEAFGGAVTLAATSTDIEASTEMLESGEVDLLIVAPTDALASLDAGEHARFRVVHGEVDPVMRSNIQLLAKLSVDEINRRVLSGVVTTAQGQSEELEDPLAGVRDASSQLVAALEGGDRARADEELARLRTELDAAETQRGGADDLYASIARVLGASEDDVASGVDESLDAARSDDVEAALAAAKDIEASIADLQAGIDRAQDLDPELLVSPFDADVEEITQVPTEPGIFYSPGTIVVLVQHLAVTFAALSLVRERQLGLTEVFRASPLGSGEAMAGKYLGFATLGLAVATALTGAMLGLGIEIRGSFLSYGLVTVLVILASLGLGFVLSGLSKTDTQAVQYAMITLLVSIFFTGFVLPLDQLAQPVQVISYLIPATYGIRAVHDVVFRGSSVEPVLLAGLVVYAAAMAVAAWWVVRREVVLVGNGRTAT